MQKEITPGCSKWWEKNTYRVRAVQQGNTTYRQEGSPCSRHPGQKLPLVGTGLDVQPQNGILLVRVISAQRQEPCSPGNLHFRDPASLLRIFSIPLLLSFPFNYKHSTEMTSLYSCFSPPPTPFLYATTALVLSLGNKKCKSLNKFIECLICSLPKSPFPGMATGSYLKLCTLTLSLGAPNDHSL